MNITQEDKIKLNYLARGEGALAIEYLADLLYNYYAKQTVYVPTDKDKNSGAAQLADWLKQLPKGLNA